MTFSVHQPWDPLKVCIVGRSYPPEFYSWIKIPHVRSLFEKIAIETEEDYQAIIKKLESFKVKVVRPNLNLGMPVTGKFQAPPMCPRDLFVMIGEKFYCHSIPWESFYENVKDPSWPDLPFEQLPIEIQEECVNMHGWGKGAKSNAPFSDILNYVEEQGNQLIFTDEPFMNGAMVSRIGKDLYFGTTTHDTDISKVKAYTDKKFPDYRTHVVNTVGHSDGSYCPVCPGLIISLQDIPSYTKTFPGWEVVYLPGQSWEKVKTFTDLKKKNAGKWWIPGFEYDQDVINVVESWLSHWTGYVEETVFDVNMLVIDPKNVIVFNYNKTVFDALERYGITPHIVPFRHRYFWDGGIHCVTTDLHREGVQQDYFPQRG